MDGSWVVSIMIVMHPLARAMMTLFVRAHRDRRTGRNTGRRGSKEAPTPDATVLIRSIAAPDNRVLSEIMLVVRGRDKVRRIGMRSAGKSQAPFRHMSPNALMFREIISHESSVSGRHILLFKASTADFNSAADTMG